MKISILFAVLASSLYFGQAREKIFIPKQDSLAIVKRDSLKPFKNIPSFNVPFAKTDSLDLRLANLYKMPVSSPKNPEIYSSLKAQKLDTAKYFIPNLINPLPLKKFAVKDK